MIDCSDENCLSTYDTLCSELSNYSDELMAKPRIVLCNKIDVEGAFDRAVEIQRAIQKKDKSISVIPVSVLTGRGMNDAKNQIVSLINEYQKERTKQAVVNEAKNDFLSSRAFSDDEEIQYPGSEN